LGISEEEEFGWVFFLWGKIWRLLRQVFEAVRREELRGELEFFCFVFLFLGEF
jgi:hypothetical protein